MDKKVQRDVLNTFYQGKLHDVYERENKIILIIDMSEFKEYYHFSYFKCELIKCEEFTLKFKGEHIKDLEQIKKLNMTFWSTEFINFQTNGELYTECEIHEGGRASLFFKTESMKVYDELDREISLFDLSVLDGLCTSGTGIDFYIKDSHSKSHVKFNEELQDYLTHKEQYWKRYKENGSTEQFDLLIGLDQYGDKVFSIQEIIQLKLICDGLHLKYSSDSLKDQQVRYFSNKLKKICEVAIKINKFIEAIGD
ncbi:hypothetical protein ACFVRR_12480 [Gottfriedia sp. NPDC057948]|uniref:hypothetical protein n=1 Tax=Gottfriedia sp. NPDC057948 TaxID=3346287 RepID=UPI0036D99315